MASKSGVKSFAVGQISQVLSKTRKRKKDEEENSGLQSLFSLSNTEQPVFVPVIEKKKKKISDDKDFQQKPLKNKKSKKDLKADEASKNSDDDDESDDNKTPLKSPEDPERLKRTLFVGNIPVTLKKKAINKLFDRYGEVESVRLRSAALAKPTMSRTVGMKKKEFHKSRHTLNAYIVFKDESCAVDALQSNGVELDGMHIRVDMAGKSKDHDHSKSVFVGNLHFATEEEPLREFFKNCGEIESLRLIRDGKTGIGKGFGFVLFKRKDAVGFAIKLNQTEFNGRPIRVFPSSEHPRKGHTFISKVRKGKPETYSFSGLQAKKNQKMNKLKYTKRKDNLGNKKKTGKRAGKNSGQPSKRSLAYKQVLNKKGKAK